MSVAVAINYTTKLKLSLKYLIEELEKKVQKFNKIIKIGRTHCQDATPITLG